jgi:hypothetical protein
MIELVISGGQTGADQAGWRAAKAAGIATGGWMPGGFLTEDGPRPAFEWLYGAKETMSRGYPERTRLNAQIANVTLWFGNPDSRGGKLTLNSCQGPYVVIWRESPRNDWHPAPLASWLGSAITWSTNCRTLNIAGNRESSAPGIGAWVEQYLSEVFRLLKASDSPAPPLP